MVACLVHILEVFPFNVDDGIHIPKYALKGEHQQIQKLQYVISRAWESSNNI